MTGTAPSVPGGTPGAGAVNGGVVVELAGVVDVWSAPGVVPNGFVAVRR